MSSQHVLSPKVHSSEEQLLHVESLIYFEVQEQVSEFNQELYNN